MKRAWLAAGPMLVMACEAVIGADFDSARPRDGSGQSADTGGGGRGGLPGRHPAGESGAAGAGDSEPSGGSSSGAEGGSSGDDAGAAGSAGSAGKAGGASSPELDALDLRAADADAVSRGPNLLDLFTIESGKLVSRRFSDGWHAPVEVEGPEVSFRSVAATLNGERIDLFASDDEGNLYHWASAFGVGQIEWVAWESLGIPNVHPGTRLAATSWQWGRLDLFWFTTAGNLGHLSASGNAWEGWATGELDPRHFHLRPLEPLDPDGPLEAASWTESRLDFFFISAAGAAYHHWYDANDFSYWGREEAPHKRRLVVDEVDPGPAVQDLAAVGSPGEGFDLFLRRDDSRSAVQRARFRNRAWRVLPVTNAGSNVLMLELIGVNDTHVVLHDAVRWNDPYWDLLGSDAEEQLWRAWFD